MDRLRMTSSGYNHKKHQQTALMLPEIFQSGFIGLLSDELDIDSFKAWFVACADLKKIMGDELYHEILAFEKDKKFIAKVRHKIHPYFDVVFIEHARIHHALVSLMNLESDVVNKIKLFDRLYRHGASIFQPFSFIYCFDLLPLLTLDNEILPECSIEAKKIYYKIALTADRVLSELDSGQMVIHYDKVKNSFTYFHQEGSIIRSSF